MFEDLLYSRYGKVAEEKDGVNYRALSAEELVAMKSAFDNWVKVTERKGSTTDLEKEFDAYKVGVLSGVILGLDLARENPRVVLKIHEN